MHQLDLRILPPAVWRPMETKETRSSHRTSERELERIPVTIVHPASGRKSSGYLWDYAATGFAVLLPRFTASANLPIKEGDVLEVTLALGSRLPSARCRVENIGLFRGSFRLGLKRLDIESIVADEAEVAGLRIARGGVEAEIRNDFLYGEWCDLTLTGLERGPILIFSSADPSLSLFPGAEVRVHLKFPSSRENSVLGRIDRLSTTATGGIRFHLIPRYFPAELANELAESLVFESNLPPEEIKSLGFPARYFRNRLEFRFAANMKDYRKVIVLRRNAYVEAGKKAADTAPESMSSEWDRKSRILCAFHEDTLVASVTLTFPESESAILRSQAAFPGSEYPPGVPAKTDLIEINSLCTHLDYRKGDVLHALFEQIARCFLLSDRSHILTLCDENLLKLYLKVGFRNLGHRCTYLGIEHHLIRGDKDGIRIGKGVPILAWAGLYGDLVQDLMGNGLLEASAWEKRLIRFKLLFLPLSKRILGARMEKMFRKHLDSNKGDLR
ncbi:MAG: hypothetical protein ABIW76_22940 [Fibrobacteria bacterium]